MFRSIQTRAAAFSPNPIRTGLSGLSKSPHYHRSILSSCPSFSTERCVSVSRPSLSTSSVTRRQAEIVNKRSFSFSSSKSLRTETAPANFAPELDDYTAQAVLNPRTDEDGKPLHIRITPRAASRLRAITSPKDSTVKNGDECEHLRVTVTSGGCHGFQYMMSLDPPSKIDREEDTVFEPSHAAAAASSGPKGHGGAARVVMDLPSLEVLHGSMIDYTSELIGSQFQIVDNPRASSSCGCGTSFDVV